MAASFDGMAGLLDGSRRVNVASSPRIAVGVELSRRLAYPIGEFGLQIYIPAVKWLVPRWKIGRLDASILVLASILSHFDGKFRSTCVSK